MYNLHGSFIHSSRHLNYSSNEKRASPGGALNLNVLKNDPFNANKLKRRNIYY